MSCTYFELTNVVSDLLIRMGTRGENRRPTGKRGRGFDLKTLVNFLAMHERIISLALVVLLRTRLYTVLCQFYPQTTTSSPFSDAHGRLSPSQNPGQAIQPYLHEGTLFSHFRFPTFHFTLNNIQSASITYVFFFSNCRDRSTWHCTVV